MPSENVENYLKRIYTIQLSGERVSTSSISEKLRISPASVSEMVKRLAAEGHVLYTPYKGVELTEQGRKRAVNIIRRHRLWELFLVKVLGYDWDEIHDEAERLEHMTSSLLEQRLDKFLGFPRLDPHGDVIPTADGVVHKGTSVRLADAPATSMVVRRVSDEDPDILKYAARLRIVPNKQLKLKERMAFDGSLRVSIDGSEHFISERLAENIFVELTPRRKEKKRG